MYRIYRLNGVKTRLFIFRSFRQSIQTKSEDKMLSQSGIICTQYNYLEAARSIIAKELSAMDVKLYLDSV